MKTKFKVDKEFIVQAHKEACDEWKQKLEEKFPDAFKGHLEVGKWYKHSSGCIVNYQGKTNGYGVNSYGLWENVNCWTFEVEPEEWKLATDKEVEKALIQEAKKRGFKKGVQFKCLYDGKTETISEDYFALDYDGDLRASCPIQNGIIFKDGKWAEPIENQTLKRIQEIEKELKELKQSL